MMNRPEKTEYADYYDRYVSLVPEGDITVLLDENLRETLAALNDISDDAAAFRYAPEKWSIKELIGHMIDTERVFAYRALCFARNDKTPLPSFDQDEYARNASFDNYPMKDLTAEFEAVRRSTVLLFKNLNETEWTRRGIASENEVTVRALAYIIAGHEIYHRRILRDKYLKSE
jgi:uncharacterized damage-inducible protein DinB